MPMKEWCAAPYDASTCAGGTTQRSRCSSYYGAPAPYAESIAPSQHGSTYAHYYEDEEDGWGMPNFYDTYGKNSKIARSNGSLYNAGMYGPQYAPQGEVGRKRILHHFIAMANRSGCAK